MSVAFGMFWICLGAFVIEIVLGKIAILSGDAVHPLLGDVPHFLLLALTAVFLTAECLRREARRNDARTDIEPTNSSKAPPKNQQREV
jgi:hypothetical protein